MQRLGQPAEPLKAIDCNVTTGPHCNLSNSQFIRNDSPIKDETICEFDVKMDAVVADPSAKEEALNLHDVSIPHSMKHLLSDEEWEIFDSVFLLPTIVNDPVALAQYLATKIEERKKPKKRPRIIYVDALCEEIGTWPKKGRWDFDCLFP